MRIESQLEPTLPNHPDLRAAAAAVVDATSTLGRGVHPVTADAIGDLLRTVNCYYSNLIEGHDTHPVDIERAMRDDFLVDARARLLQQEARAHIAVQAELEAQLAANPQTNPGTTEWLCDAHARFYRRLPAELRVVGSPDGSRHEVIEPGALRQFDVRVGGHVAPPWSDVEPLLARFAAVYDPADATPDAGMVKMVAAHHRLLWIHPFGDGNGRVTRLFTEIYLRRLRLPGVGLWSMARGLARRADDYRRALAAADSPRWTDTDGRGPLSEQQLIAFCRFMLDVALDQIAYMRELLQVDRLVERAVFYGRARAAGLITGMAGTLRQGRWSDAEAVLLVQLLTRGSLARGDVPALLRLPERSARRVVQAMTADGWITSPTSRAPLRVAIPAHGAPYLLPGLFRTQA